RTTAGAAVKQRWRRTVPDHCTFAARRPTLRETGMTTVAAQPPHPEAGSVWIMTQASSSHAVNHFHLMTLPALMPLLPAHYGVGYLEIGFALTVLSVVSLVVHIPI